MKSRALMVMGTGSNVGKSLITQGLLAYYASLGLKVAPFKAQNMSLNSHVTQDGHEIAKAQAVQAEACFAKASYLNNPVLLKPVKDQMSEVIFLGEPYGFLSFRDYRKLRGEFFPKVLESLDRLMGENDLVIIEGAGSGAEVNLDKYDFANANLAKEIKCPILIVGDIDRGGIFPQLYGTHYFLDDCAKALVKGFVVNKFRGDRSFLDGAFNIIKDETGKEVVAVINYDDFKYFGTEDSLSNAKFFENFLNAESSLKAIILNYPFSSNLNDFEPLVAEENVSVTLSSDISKLDYFDLIILPGSKLTVSSLEWLLKRDIKEALDRAISSGSILLGICAGFQMLGKSIEDNVETRVGKIPGLSYLSSSTVFQGQKTIRREKGKSNAFEGSVEGFFMHYGKIIGNQNNLFDLSSGPEGEFNGAVFGTSLHGLFENDSFRKAFLTNVALKRNISFKPGKMSFSQIKKESFKRLANIISCAFKEGFLKSLI